MPAHTECDYERAIEVGLIGAGGYRKRRPNAYDKALALFPDDVTGFLKDSQPARWQALEKLLGSKTAATVLDSLSKELELKGTLHVLRHGFKCYGKTLRMAWFRPNTHMNPEAAENYASNRLTVTRQIGVEPLWWIPNPLACGKENPRCHEPTCRTRPSFATRWWSWPARDGRSESSHASSSARTGPSVTGSARATSTRAAATTD